MPEDKDRYGDKLREAERGREDKFFADRDRELIEKMQHKQAGPTDAAPGDAAVRRCPKDGQQLSTVDHLGVMVDVCPACGGMWLDKGELEQVAKREASGWLARYLDRPR